ncbi:Protein BZZ1, partial [Coemansia aciculifera]
DSLALTDTEAETSTGPLELTVAVFEWAERLGEEGRMHVTVGTKAASDVADELKAAYDGLGEARKKTLEGHQRLLAERDAAFEQKDRARSAYEAKAKALALSRQRQERATTEKDQDKLRQRMDREVAERNQSKNAYVLHVATANAAKNAVARVLTPRAMDAMQRVNDQRVAATRRLMLQLLAVQTAADGRRQEATKRAMAVVARVAETADSDRLVARRGELGGHWEEPPDFRVVVDTAAGDDDAVALDGESQAILRNLALQAQRDARQAEDERRTAAEAAEQCRQRATDPSSSSAWAAELKAAADFDRDAAIAELHSVQHRALFSAVESHLGHAVVNGTLHAFKPVTLALSRTCDYCSESIGGLNRKAARCSLCDYTCHAKCQIKVVPNCQGPDPAQKSGFLSMFGSLRNKKKPSNNANSGGASHVRSASL